MTRRGLVLSACPVPQAPTDQERLNAFASAYNIYAEALKAGRIDLKAWKRCSDEWTRLNDTK